MKFQVGDRIVYHETIDIIGYDKDFDGTEGVIVRVNIGVDIRFPYIVNFNLKFGDFPCSEKELTLIKVKSIEEFL